MTRIVKQDWTHFTTSFIAIAKLELINTDSWLIQGAAPALQLVAN